MSINGMEYYPPNIILSFNILPHKIFKNITLRKVKIPEGYIQFKFMKNKSLYNYR